MRERGERAADTLARLAPAPPGQALRSRAQRAPPQPNVICEAPPGGADTRLELRAVRKLPTFWPDGRW